MDKRRAGAIHKLRESAHRLVLFSVRFWQRSGIPEPIREPLKDAADALDELDALDNEDEDGS